MSLFYFSLVVQFIIINSGPFSVWKFLLVRNPSWALCSGSPKAGIECWLGCIHFGSSASSYELTQVADRIQFPVVWDQAPLELRS